MFRKVLWVLLASMLASILMVSGCSRDEMPTEPTETEGLVDPNVEVVYYHLRTPKTLEEIADKIYIEQVAVAEVRIAVEGLIAGYTVDERPLGDIKSDLLLQHTTFLQYMEERAQQSDAPLSITSVDWSGIIEETRQNGLRISSVAMLGQLLEATRLLLEAEVDTETPILPTARPMEEETAGDRSYNHERWAPYGGHSEVTKSRTYQEFIFNNMSDYGSTRTYEHETQIYDRNFANYAGYWSSNLPNAYKDTQVGDNIDNFTVGSAKASNLVAQRWYWTYMSLSSQSAPTAICRIKGQIGHRSPSWCYSTWCIFPDNTTEAMATLTVPNNGFCWQY